jgi:hypothetical protein
LAGSPSYRQRQRDAGQQQADENRFEARCHGLRVCQRPEKPFDFNTSLEAGLPLERIEIIQKQSFRLIGNEGFYPSVSNRLRPVCQLGFGRFANSVPLTFCRKPY